MKLTKKQENEIWQVYDTWLYSYLNGDVKTYNKYLDKDYHFIGSTDNEEFLNKKDTTNFFKSTADQLAGKCDLRNETKIIEQFEGLVFITHLFDAWFKINNDYAYYGRFRFTNALKENNEGWRFIYQHFSTTDSKTDKGETIGFDKVSAENQELREAIKRRTFELEQKNRELEVETALERIRAKAVAMKASSDLLDIVVTMRNEFIKLGHEAHYFWHMMWLPKTYEKAMTSGDGSKIGFVMELPRHIHGDIPLLAKWEKSKKPTVVYAMNVDEALDYVDKMVSLGDFKNIDPQAPTEADIRHVGGLTFIMAKTTHGEIGYSLPGIVKNPPKEDIDILVKFAGAFDLAHKRFLDLQKAEKQAKETLIDLSLERIRSRVTAMQESSDLFEIVVAMRNEFISLGHQADYFWHMKWLEDNYEMSMTAEDGGRLGMVITVPKFVHEQIESLYKWEKSNSPYFVLALNGKEAWDYIEKMNTYGKYKLVDPHAPTEEDILHIRGLTFIIARTTHGEIGFSLAGKVENPPKASIDILVRFANVFDLAYKRFEDLQKAEKQARETQIELALEKVRSRTMAMQHSDELQEASFLLDQQVRALGIKTWGCAFNIYGEKESTEWFGNEAGVLHTYTVPREGIFKEYYDKGQKGETLFIQEFSGDECVAHYEYMSSLPVIGDVLKTLKKRNNGFPTYQIDHVVYFKYGYLLFITRESVPESHDVFKRFAKVFEQTYTRFLDLQKAEAQARESEIELALERVRARTLAMQHSDELAETAALLFKQINDLGIETWTSGFNIWEKNDASFIGYNPTPSGDITAPYQIPSTEDSFFKKIHKAKKNGEAFLVFKASGKSLVKTYDYMKTLPVVKDVLQGIEDSGTQLPKSQINHSAFFSHGFLLFITLEPYPEAHGIFKRFAKVFEQTYTRFLDLQKAEAQAREAQIEAALERVRSRSMAMHKSEELLEAGALLYSELSKLGIKHLTTGYILFNEKAEIGYSYGVNPADGSIRHQPVAMIHNQTKTMKTIVASWKKQEPLLVIELNEKETIKHQTFIAEKSTNFPLTAAQLLAISPQRLVIHCFNFKQGYLLIVGGMRLIIEQQEMVVRFAKVFQQTYTRFLDLQKAEAQAREAQIEAALERVRSRSMAMHNSEELKDVIQILYEQFVNLNIHIDHAGFILDYKENDDMHIWLADQHAVFPEITLPYFDCAHWNSFNEAKKKGQNFFTNQLDFEEKNKFYKDLFEFIPDLPEDTKKTYFEFEGLAISTVLLDTIGLYIENYSGIPFSDDENTILMRFGKVFQQTYTRFLDLQKAEAQTREAQIEAALERVRSRSMAMHNSDEIGDVAFVLFQQLKSLGGEFWGTGFGFCKNNSTVDEFWFANENGIMPHLKIPNNEDEAHKKMYRGWKNNLDSFSLAKGGKKLKDHYKYMLTVPDVQPIFQGILDNGISFPKWQKWHAAYFKYGYLLAITTAPYENEDIFKRFAKVFEQAYTRFLDLQKAEAQAREAQIEAALERVRSQSMGMQTSQDLSNVTSEMFNQLRQFGGELFATGIVFCDKHEGHVEQWHSLPDAGMMSPFIVPIDLDYIHQYRYDEWKKGTELFSVEIPSDFIEQHFQDIFNLPSAQKVLKDFEDQNTPMPEAPPWEIDYGASFKHGYILVSSLEHFKEVEILPRFAKVFEQTYTRFLDLQKAEAQAREVQIEMALEKVRSRTMAMQHSKELPEAANVLFTEVQNLGIPAWSCGYNILSEDKKSSTCIMSSEGEIQSPFILPLTKHKSLKPWHKAILNNEDFFVYEQGGKDLKEHYDYMQSLPELKETFQQFKEANISLPTFQVNHLAKFTNGFLLFITYERIPEAHDIFQRFAKVFQQTYTRFLDLQKAEAQTREAQIEASLERVRARAMAMHDSNELDEVLSVLCEQFDVLGILPMSTHMTVFDFEHNTFTFRETGKFGNRSFGEQTVALDAMNNWKETVVKWKADKPTTINKLHFPKEQLKEVWEVFHESFASMPEGSRITTKDYPNGIYHTAGKHPFGYIGMNQIRPATEEEEQIVIKFANEFGRAYQRFLDLKKAEAQTREAQINLAVERVRAKALAMHKSEEILEVVAKLKDEVMNLDIPDVVAATIFLKEGDDKVRMWDLSSLEDEDNYSEVPFDVTFKIKKTDPHFYIKRVWENPEHYFVEIQDEKGFKRLMQWLREMKKNEIADEVEEFIEKTQLKRLYHTVKKLNNGKLAIDLLNPPSDEMESILTKMGAAFDLAYKRFEDLQKAEAQTREAQIEAALERIRSRSMAMHKSEELLDVITVVSEQLIALGFKFSHVSFANNNIDENYNFWTSAKGHFKPMRFCVPFLDLAVFNNIRKAQNKSAIFLTDIITKEEHNNWHNHLLKHGGSEVFSKTDNEYIMSKGMARSIAINPNIMLILANYASIPYSEAENKIIARFGQVFEQSYTRFLDLQKAETQAREAQIEAALEKVRSRSLAMHNADELGEVVLVIVEKLKELGVILDANGITLCTYFTDSKDVLHWIASPDFSHVGKHLLPYFDHVIFKDAWQSKEKGDAYFSKAYSIKEKNSFFEHAFEHSDYKHFPEEFKQWIFKNDKHILSFAWQKNSALLIPSNTGVLPTDEEKNILIRFAKVFEQAYIRFMDLKKSEAQAREAKIEAALEKVRSRTLAMQNSDELAETSVVVFQQLLELGIAPNRLFIGIVKENDNKIEAWATNEDGSKLAKHFTLQASKNKSIKKMLNGWKQKEKSLVIDLKGKELQDYFKYLNEDMDIPFIHGLDQKRRVQTIAYFSGGLIGMAAPEEQPKETIDLLERFAAVFNLTYTRFNDLKVAEAQTREAKIEGALERVRARALAMQQPEELKDVAKVLRHEMGLLDIEELETCSIYINDEASKKTECWYALKDIRSKKQKLINDHFELNLKDTWVGREMQKFYKSKNKETSIVMTGDNRKEWIAYCEKHSMPFKGYYGKEIPDRTYHLYKFSHGAIGVATPRAISDENWSLIKRTASVFSLAYSRFKDLTQARLDLIKLKEEKQRAEEALAELQTTQTQLIQSEKMASLGELTAGIAHEIQNPLNFVNNFSEVSKELLEEMLEEIENGDMEEVRAIMNDVIQNLEKINHHGKRADGIVKGMLQHSRSSSGTKEPVNINVLADEYLRLAYHGLRAKDKSFNATLVTDFDDTIGNIKIIPQDIGRVVLNLLTNAFYVVNEKKQSNKNGYDPTVSLSTKKNGKWVTITVKDNGNGIPKHVLEKIFQPFFTTKPTGQGTGLGLSMSYDIVTKGHGGELKVNTEQNKGTEFIIKLPI